MTESGTKMGRWRIWLLAARPKTLWAGVAPVLIGGAMAYDYGGFHVGPILAALTGSLLIQIGTNFANDLFDHLKASDTEERVGPTRVTQAGLVSPRRMVIATTVVFGLACLVGLYLVYRGGVPVLIIGLASIICGILYTGGPYPLAYVGLGDIFVLIFFGPVAVAGTFYVTTLEITTTALLAGLPAGMMSTAILTVNNLRDITTDAATGKRTLAVRFGASFVRAEYGLMMVGAILFPLLLFLLDARNPWILLACVSLPVALPAIRKVAALDGPPLNEVLALTGKVLALFSILFSLGWML